MTRVRALSGRASYQLLLTGLVVLSILYQPAEGQGGAHHDKQYWLRIAQTGYKVPAGESPAALIAELTDYLGSPDPELRDSLAYEISAAWIYRDGLLSHDEIRPLMQKCENNLRGGGRERR